MARMRPKDPAYAAWNVAGQTVEPPARTTHRSGGRALLLVTGCWAARSSSQIRVRAWLTVRTTPAPDRGRHGRGPVHVLWPGAIELPPACSLMSLSGSRSSPRVGDERAPAVECRRIRFAGTAGRRLRRSPSLEARMLYFGSRRTQCVATSRSSTRGWSSPRCR